MKVNFKLHIAIVVLLVTILVAGFVPREFFGFEIEDGRCDCCKCGMMSCSKCVKMGRKCCPSVMGWERYTFTERSTPYVMTLAQALTVDKKAAKA